ncbi:MAG: T9SS type A sorting domain-containing protein [Crocinitomicaceae bacterium]
MKAFCVFVFTLFAQAISAQHNNEFYNDGAAVTVQTGAEIYVMGDFHNYQTSGLLRNDGFVEIQGHAFSDNLFEQRGVGTALFINNDVNAGQTQYISGSYAVRGGQAAIGVNDGSFYNLQLANDQGIVWLNGAGNIADVRNSVDFNGPGSPVVNRIITHDPTAIPANGSGYSATFGLMNSNPGLGGLTDNTVTTGGNMSGTDNGYIQGNFRRAIAAAGGTYNYVLGLEPAGGAAQRGMQYMNLIFGANNYDVISGYFQTGLDNTFPAATECSGYIIDYWGGVDHGQWVMSDITGAGTGAYETRVWPQDDNFPVKSIWVVTKDNTLQGTANDCGPTVVGLDRAGFLGMGQFGVAASEILLPAELINIWANPKVDHIEIGWSVGSEYNVDYYAVQRSENGIDFETVAIIDAMGTTQSQIDYSYDDYNVGRNKNYYYRYQSFDFDLFSEYSPLVNAMLKGSDNFSESILLYPNPTNGALFMELSLDLKSQIQLTVLNSAGQQVMSSVLQGYTGNNVFALNSKNWASGVYIVQVTELRTGEIVHRKIIKD